MTGTDDTPDSMRQIATFGGGCFWCTEAVFSALRGVHSVASGYAGGHVPHPSYKDVCTGTTGHAEVIRIEFDPAQISFEELLEVFFATHDPTTLNRQGNDVGTQYRSVVFYHDDEQRQSVERLIRELNESGDFPSRLITEVSPFTNFYPAEEYHANYFALNPRQPYCQGVIGPKVEKFRKKFTDRLK